jgi:hypothetical protein
MIIVLIDLWIKKWVISSKYAVEEIILLIWREMEIFLVMVLECLVLMVMEDQKK